jgi:paired amphipathic helix protein Sin3a
MLKDSATFDLTNADRIERWKYYNSCFVRVEPTEGIRRSLLGKTVLTRNLPDGNDADSTTSSEQGLFGGRKDVRYKEGLVLRICVNTYKMMFQAGTQDSFLARPSKSAESAAKAKEKREERFLEKFERNTRWMAGLGQGQVQKINEEFAEWVEEKPRPG